VGAVVPADAVITALKCHKSCALCSRVDF
jgi:hypothetical protein